MKILVTGGAGFIGSHLVDELIKKGHQVSIFDNLESQVHPAGKMPSYFNKRAEFIKGDVRSRAALLKAMEGIEVIFHFAAAVGIGQSMYQIKKYVEVNIGGTANILDILANNKHRVKKFIMPGSATSYGECAYRCLCCGTVYPPLRKDKDVKMGIWDPLCSHCGKPIEKIGIDENKPLEARFVYALNKKWQEELAMSFGVTHHLPVVILRLFNVYGPRQSLFNPYAGVIAVFSARLKAGKPPIIIEDGLQTRDFVFVGDVVKAFILAMEKDEADFEIFNVGTGKSITIKKLAQVLIDLYEKNIKPEVNFAFRKGDVRHSLANISKIKRKLGWQPTVSLKAGLKEVFLWYRKQLSRDGFERAFKELIEKKLV